MDRDILEEQKAYYRARAEGYHEAAVLDQVNLGVVQERIGALGSVDRVLELACGTGVWTRELVRIGKTVTAIDASPEMLALNRRWVADSRVTYLQADLFEWEPDRDYDLVFTSFWLSHVPPNLLDGFLRKVHRSVRPGGHLLIVDQCDDLKTGPFPTSAITVEREGILEKRRLPDGRTFTIVKVYYHPTLLANRLNALGFDASAQRVGHSFFVSWAQKR